MKKTASSRKAGEELRAKVANVLLLHVSDPRLALVTVTGCDVSPDREVADVFVAAPKERYDEVEAGLAAASGRIRALVGKSLSWRVTPELRFRIDKTGDAAERISEVLNEEARSASDAGAEKSSARLGSNAS
jgi:ribosome-binding factor A